MTSASSPRRGLALRGEPLSLARWSLRFLELHTMRQCLRVPSHRELRRTIRLASSSSALRTWPVPARRGTRSTCCAGGRYLRPPARPEVDIYSRTQKRRHPRVLFGVRQITFLPPRVGYRIRERQVPPPRQRYALRQRRALPPRDRYAIRERQVLHPRECYGIRRRRALPPRERYGIRQKQALPPRERYALCERQVLLRRRWPSTKRRGRPAQRRRDESRGGGEDRSQRP